MGAECLFNKSNKEFSIEQLLDNLETIKEVLSERETAVTPELVHTLNVIILWIKNGGVNNVNATKHETIDNLLDQMIKDFFGDGKNGNK